MGDEAHNFISSIKHNCNLLLDAETVSMGNEYNIDENNTIKFFGKTAQQNIYSDIKDWIGDDVIKHIRVLSPFYDDRGSLLNSLVSSFQPDRIDTIIERGLGNIPNLKSLPDNVHLFDWDNCTKMDLIKQNLFHAKCFFFEGERYNYLICGSSNASNAAIYGSNYEANVGYKSKTYDYWANSGITIDYNKELAKTEKDNGNTDNKKKTSDFVWIKEVSYEYQNICMLLFSERSVEKASIIVQPTNKSDSFKSSCNIESNKQQKIEFSLVKDFVPFRIWIEDENGTIISNCQYAINRLGMSQNDPSPENARFRKYCLNIEQGNFLNGAIIDFINKVLNGQGLSKQLKPFKTSSDMKEKSEGDSYIFSSYDDFKKGNDIIPILPSKESTSQHRSSMLMDSIIRFIKQSAREQDDAQMADTDFTENTGKSGGSDGKAQTVVKEKTLRDMAKKLFSALRDYMHNMETITIDDIPKKASVITKEELTSFMLVCEVINRLLGYIEWLSDENRSVLDEYFIIPYNHKVRFTISEYFYRIVSLWSLHVIQNNGIIESNKYLQSKVAQYKQDALELLISVMSVCDLKNTNNEHYALFSKVYKPIVFKNMIAALDIQITDDESLIDNIYRKIDSDIKRLTDFDEQGARDHIIENIKILRRLNVTSLTEAGIGHYVFCHDLGCVFIGQFIGNTKKFVPLTTSGRYNQEKNSYRLEYAFDLETENCVKLITH